MSISLLGSENDVYLENVHVDTLYWDNLVPNPSTFFFDGFSVGLNGNQTITTNTPVTP